MEAWMLRGFEVQRLVVSTDSVAKKMYGHVDVLFDFLRDAVLLNWGLMQFLFGF